MNGPWSKTFDEVLSFRALLRHWKVVVLERSDIAIDRFADARDGGLTITGDATLAYATSTNPAELHRVVFANHRRSRGIVVRRLAKAES